MFTELCYGNRLAKITNYENWHTKLIQRCLKAEKYMTSSMTAMKTFQFYVFVYFYLFCLFFVVLYFFFFLSVTKLAHVPCMVCQEDLATSSAHQPQRSWEGPPLHLQ